MLRAGKLAGVLKVLGAVTALSVGLHVLIHVPGVPYNVRELFGAEPSPVRMAIFALVVLWVGAGGAVVGQLVTRGRTWLLAAPLLACLAGLFSFVLLAGSVTIEALDDILGSPVWWKQIVGAGIWGEEAARLLDSPQARFWSSHVEYAARYIALYGPLLLALAIFNAGLGRSERDRTRRNTRCFGVLLVYALPWFYVCKLVVIDLADTDNITELVAHRGPLGVGGEVFLLALTLLIAFNATLWSWSLRSRWRWRVVALAFTLPALFVSWHLLKHGLVSSLTKYGLTYSGVDFLLGPDRENLISKVELFARWCLAYLGALSVLSLGIYLAPSPRHA